jgi:hypothetical protein
VQRAVPTECLNTRKTANAKMILQIEKNKREREMSKKRPTTRLVFCPNKKRMIRKEIVHMPEKDTNNRDAFFQPMTLREERRRERLKEMYEFFPTSENEKLMMLIHTYGANNITFA